MEFKFPDQPLKKQELARRGNGSLFGSLSPRNSVGVANKTTADGRENSIHRYPTVSRNSDVESGPKGIILNPNSGAKLSFSKSERLYDARFGNSNERLSKVYDRLSQLKIEEGTPRGSWYKMPKRKPKKPPRKPFDITAYAKDFMCHVADVPGIQRSQKPVRQDFVLRGNTQPEFVAEEIKRKFSDLVRTTPVDVLPVPASSPSEQGRVMLPAMKPKGKKIKSGGPSFMKRWNNPSDGDSVTISLQYLNLPKTPQSPAFPNSLSGFSSGYREHHVPPKLEYVKFTVPTSQQTVKIQLDEPLSYITKAYNQEFGTRQNEFVEQDWQESDEFPTTQESGLRRQSDVSVPLTTTANSSMEISYNTISNSDMEKLTVTPVNAENCYSVEEGLKKQLAASSNEEKKISKRRKVEAMKNRLTKTQNSDGTPTKASESQQSTGDRQKLPPISANDQLVTASSHSTVGSTHKSRRSKAATDADDESEKNDCGVKGRSKRYRKQPHFYSSDSEDITSDTTVSRRRKKRKRQKLSSIPQGRSKRNLNLLSSNRLISSTPKLNQPRIRYNASGEAIALNELNNINDKNLRNTTSESIISRYIADLARQGHIASSEDGDDELEEDDEFSKISRT